jgi:hypothetical protein
MSELLCTRTTRVMAKAIHGVAGSRVEITVLSQRKHGPTAEQGIIIGFDPIELPHARRVAEAVAAAITMVDQKFNPTPTLNDVLSVVAAEMEPA